MSSSSTSQLLPLDPPALLFLSLLSIFVLISVAPFSPLSDSDLFCRFALLERHTRYFPSPPFIIISIIIFPNFKELILSTSHFILLYQVLLPLFVSRFPSSSSAWIIITVTSEFPSKNKIERMDFYSHQRMRSSEKDILVKKHTWSLGSSFFLYY